MVQEKTAKITIVEVDADEASEAFCIAVERISSRTPDFELRLEKNRFDIIVSPWDFILPIQDAELLKAELECLGHQVTLSSPAEKDFTEEQLQEAKARFAASL